MAIEFLTITWQMSPYKAEKLLAHLAFADWANIAGEFHPSADELAEKARLTRRGAFQVIAQMIEDGEIELIVKGGGRGQRNRYRFAAHYREAVVQLSRLSDRLLLIPLKAKGRINGILIMGPKSDGEEYLAEEKAFLSDLASLAAIAVENARLYELATVDMMTKLKIHHFFQTRLREEMELARETGQPLSLLLTDIDHFKKFNDTYGHQIGDLVLKEVAKVLITAAKGKDLAARYGGEEFSLIAPGRDLETALAIAEKYRERIEKLNVKNPTDKGDKILKVTVSVGVAMDLDVVYVETSAHEQGTLKRPGVGAVRGIVETAMGRAWLAQLSLPDRTAFLARVRKARPGEYTRSTEGLKDSLANYAKRGFAINMGDAGLGVLAVGVASNIRYGSRRLLFNCAVPGYRAKSSDLVKTIGPAVLQLVNLAGRQVGLR